MTDETELEETPAAESEPATEEQATEAAGVPEPGEESGEPKPDADDTKAEQEQPQQGKSRAKKRIRQLNRELRSERVRNDRIEKEVEALKKRLGPDPETVRPTRQNFDSDEAYEDALFEWKDNATRADSGQQQEAGAIPPERQQVLDDFEAKLDEIGDDAADTVLYGEDWPVTPIMTEYCLESEKGAELAYHLATHHDVAERITKMSPIMAVRELEKLEGKLSAGNTGVQTPPPPAKTGKPGGSSAGIDEDKLDDATWNRMWKAGTLPSQQKANG